MYKSMSSVWVTQTLLGHCVVGVLAELVQMLRGCKVSLSVLRPYAASHRAPIPEERILNNAQKSHSTIYRRQEDEGNGLLEPTTTF